ncbi:MAG: hypothetical protein IJM14_08865 [Lachnospiraceae bacterium]|nr:hypothetical protein [Lachnospiraceae bacterium]
MSEEEKKEPIDTQKEEVILRTTKVLKVLFVVLAIAVIIMLIYRLTTGKKKESDTTLYIMKNADKHVSSLGEYKKLGYTRHDTLVTDDEINEKIQGYVTRGTRYEKLDGRMGSLLEPGDIVNCTYVVSKDGKELEKKTGLFEIGSGKFAEFEKALVGHVVGDTVEFNATVPADYETADDKTALKGEKLNFSVTLNYVCSRYVPELDDSFASEITGGECTSVDGLHDYFYEKLTKRKETEAMAEIKDELLAKLIESTSFKDLDGLVDNDFGKMKDYYETLASTRGLSFEDYMKNELGMEPDEWEKDCRELLLESIKERLVLQSVADKEKLKVKKNSKEYKEMIDEYMAKDGYTDEKKYLEDIGEDVVLCNMTYELAIKFIMSTAVAES